MVFRNKNVKQRSIIKNKVLQEGRMIIVIKKGCGIISVDTKPRVVKAGDIVLVRPGQLHSISQHGKDCMEYENILFQTSLLYSADSDPRTVGYFQPYFSLEYELPWLFDDTCFFHEALSSDRKSVV